MAALEICGPKISIVCIDADEIARIEWTKDCCKNRRGLDLVGLAHTEVRQGYGNCLVVI